MSKQVLVTELVQELGKDSPIKKVVEAFKVKHGSTIELADTTLNHYIQVARKQLGYTKEYVKSTKVVITPESVKNAKEVKTNLDMSTEDILKVIGQVKNQDLNLLEESLKLIASLDA